MTTTSAPLTLRKKSRWQLFWTSPAMRKLRRNPLAITGLLITLLFGLMALFAPLIAKPTGDCLRDLNLTSASQVTNPANGAFWRAILAPPASCYKMERVSFAQEPKPASEITGTFAPFGTVNGYNIFYGLIWGTRTALKMSFIIVAITLTIGVIIGAISGYYGGWIDNLIQRFIDVLFALPPLILTVVLLTILRAKNPGGDPTGPIILAFSVAGWASYAKIIRGDVLRTRQLEYVDAARGLGARDPRLILKHVVPNSVAAVFTIAVLDLATVPLSVAALSFLGLGFEPGSSEWGQLVDFSRAWLKPEYWYALAYPAAFIITFSLAFNLFGDGLRDAMDPKSR
ncbi:peptide ABC transporter permease [Deinococcus malanensis]|uniref:Peptide ABC transporter permease n=1 Tax=Deinococcus malanensis TaxID=1706855 RepID=A0ABQ2EV46_9DEIO|nr:ABC transporter permease [Deinococcus malanensis]GGK23861.1 peptide ABC transporter permease [Deinococcus malanensis]